MTELLNVRAPNCAGDLFLGDCTCPKCGTIIQITVQNRRGDRFEATCASCGQSVTGPLP